MEMEAKIVSNRSREREQFLADVLTTAVEGGTNYWAWADDYVWSDTDPSTTHVKLTAMDESELSMDVTIDTVAKGVGAVIGRKVKVRDDLVETLRYANIDDDAGEVDATLADVIVQAALFGEVRYG